MKIRRLHIYGFGMLIDEVIPFNDTFHVIQGQNESGKSTIHAFIQAILFGFPTKKEKLLRYEPKTASAYGGNMMVELDNGETVTIERTMKRKARGDVVVSFENGETVGEQWLRQMLGNINRTTFQGIFCFGLDGLSEVGQLKGQELNQYLYEAGTTGTQNLHLVEKELTKQMEQLFKKQGKKPIINQMLLELQQIQWELRAWEKEFDRYDQLLDEKERLVREMEEIRQEKNRLQIRLMESERKQSLKKLWEEQQSLVREKNFLKKFPLISTEVEEKVKQCVSALEERKERLLQWEQWKVEEERNMTGASIRATFMREKEAITVIKEQMPLYKKLNEDYARLQQTEQNIEDKLCQLNEKLGTLPEEQLKKASTTVLAEEDLKDFVEQYKQSKATYEQVYVQKEQKEMVLTNVQEELQKMKKDKNNDKNHPFHVAMQFGAIVFLTLAVSEWIRGNIFLGSISLLLMLLCSWFFWKKPTSTSLSYKEKEWEYDRESRAYEEILSQVENARARLMKAEKSLQAWKEKYCYDFVPSIDRLEVIFPIVKDWQAHWQEFIQIKKEMAAIQAQKERIETGINLFRTKKSDVYQEGFEALVQEFLQEWEVTQRKHEQYDMRANEYLKKYQQAKLDRTSYEELDHQLQRIFQKHQVHRLEEVAEGVKHNRRYKEILQQLEWIEEKMKEQEPKESVRKKWLMEFESDEQEWMDDNLALKEALTEIDDKHMTLQETLAQVKQQIQFLEEDGSYEEKLQLFSEKKEALRQLTEEWAVLNTAKLLMEKVKKVYERERQPKVVQLASEYFSYMTGEAQYRLFAPVGENTFVVENSQGIRFTPEELSRGTAEQLYLSLRLALADTFSQPEQLPLIMDDPFVNFDHERKSRVFSLFQKGNKNRQIIYFTCHDFPHASLTASQVTSLSQHHLN